jgi:hypothetical protein
VSNGEWGVRRKGSRENGHLLTSGSWLLALGTMLMQRIAKEERLVKKFV